MATKAPRLQISLSPHVYETIRRFAQLQGRPMAAVLRDLIESVHPPLMRTVALLEAARDAPAEVLAGLRGVTENIERDMVSASGSGLAQLDWLMGEVEGGERGRQAAKRAASPPPDSLTPSKGRKKGGSNPRPSNTGVRSKRISKNQQVSKKRKGG